MTTPANACFTVITSLTPARVGKTYFIDANGKLAKTTVASISKGRAATIEATREKIVAALRQTTESTNQVIALDSFIGALPGEPDEIDIVVEKELERLMCGPITAPPVDMAGYFAVGGAMVSARLKRLMSGSSWVLFDGDSPEGMPVEWKRLSLPERLELFEAILPGVSTCLRIEYRGSSARVVNGSGEQKPGPTHALIQISDASKLDLMREYVRVQSVLKGLSFRSPHYSKTESGKIVATVNLTLFDWSVWVLGRLIFNAMPDVSNAPGYRALDADIRIVNPRGGVLDVDWIGPPDAAAIAAYREKTGLNVRFEATGEGGRLATHEHGQLTLMTEIEAQGVVKPLADWLAEMWDKATGDKEIDKLRCETPFRVSESEAAFIRIAPNGEIFVYDAGTTTSSYLDLMPRTHEQIIAAVETFEAFEAISAAAAARERWAGRQAAGMFSVITDEELAEIAAEAERRRGPTLAEVQKAASELKEKDLDGARAVLEQLVKVRGCTAAAEDVVVDTVKTALGKMVTIRAVRALLKDAKAQFARQAAKEADEWDAEREEEGGPPRGFRAIDGWMRLRVKTEDSVEWRPVCSALEVTAMLRDGASTSWGLVVHFEDADGRPHDVSLPAKIYGDPIAVASLLASEGLRLADATAPTRTALSTLLMKWKHPERRTVTATPGWTRDLRAFLLRDGHTIGDQTFVLGHGSRLASRTPGVRGDLATWKASVAALCVGNPVLLTGVSTAFAGPLLEVLNIESGVIHCRGDSSNGKTTALQATMSVWEAPTPVPSWRATANGLEGVAAAHNSILLVVDELHQVSPREAGQSALMLCNGTGKARADQHGEARARKDWRLLVLSSGECSLADRVAAADETVTAGQEVRFIDLKVDGREFGCFDDIHDAADGGAFADGVKERCAEAYGTAGPAFVEYILRTPDVEERARAEMARFIAEADTTYILLGADSQVTRGLRRFAVIAAAGELATEAGITGWPTGVAAAGVLEMFGLWLDGRGGLMSAADRNAVANTRAFLIKNEARFHKLIPDGEGELALSMPGYPIHNLAGWVDPEGYWIAGDTWRKEIHAGNDGKSAAKVLRDAGLLIADKNRGLRLTRRGPRVINRVRCYYVKNEAVGTDEGV